MDTKDETINMENEKTENEASENIVKLRRKIKIYTIIGIVSAALQLMAYFGDRNSEPEVTTDNGELISYYAGYNWLITLAIILFINIFFLKKKLKQQEQQDMVDLIGHPE